MASLYTKRGIWYLSVSYKGKRYYKSLKTMDKRTAQRLRHAAEYDLLSEALGLKPLIEEKPLSKVISLYLKSNDQWKQNTLTLKSRVLKAYLEGSPLPKNKKSKAIHVNHINACLSWAQKNRYVKEFRKISGSGWVRHTEIPCIIRK